MKKNFKIYVIAWIILLALFNAIVFVVPAEAAGMNKFSGAFWSGYIFITLAFLGQLACAYKAFGAENAEKLFYHIPLITISYTGLTATIIAGAVCMVIPNLPNWVGIILCMVILVLTALSVLKAGAAAELVENTDKNVKVKTLFIKSLTVDAEGLMARALSPEIKAEVKEVYEAVRYSDPMSCDALSDIESQIMIKFSDFSDAVTANDFDAVQSTSGELIILLNDRNKKCKLLK